MPGHRFPYGRAYVLLPSFYLLGQGSVDDDLRITVP